MRKRRHFTAEFNRQQASRPAERTTPLPASRKRMESMPINCTSGARFFALAGNVLAQHLPLIPVSIVPNAPVRPPADDPSSGRFEIELSRARIVACCVDLAAFNTILLTSIAKHLSRTQENGEGQST